MEDLFDTITQSEFRRRNSNQASRRDRKTQRREREVSHKMAGLALQEALGGDGLYGSRSSVESSYFDLDHEVASRSPRNSFSEEFDFESGPLENSIFDEETVGASDEDSGE